MNKIYNKLLNIKVEKFILDFKEAKNLYEDLDKRNKGLIRL
jgi:hypothetical protein